MKKSPLLLALCTFSLLLSSYKPKKVEPELTVIGRVNLADGICRQAGDLIENLKDELVISFIPTYPEACDSTGLSPKARSIVEKTKELGYGDIILYEEILQLPSDTVHVENFFHKPDSKRVRIAYSMCESTGIPEKWVSLLNTHFDLVAVPDKFLVDVYRKCGVKIPIYLLPLGLNMTKWIKAPLHEAPKGVFTFANLSAAFYRKNQPLLVRAFAQAFGNRSDVRLIINCRNGMNDTKKAIHREIQLHKLTNVIFRESSLDSDRYFDLMNKVDCYVSLSIGEGYSIQPREAMALGVPVIATNALAQETICATDLVRTVPANIRRKAFYELFGTYIGEHRACTVEDAAAAMRDVYENYEEYLAKGAEAKKWAATSDFSHLRPYYLSLLNPKKISLGTENKVTPNEIITNSETLFKKYSRIIEKRSQKQK